MTRTERTYGALMASYNMSWSFTAPVYPLFLLAAGLDLFQINLVLATYFLTSFCFEVPTGAVADVFGRRIAFLASCVVRAAAFTLYFFADGFRGFLVAEAIDAVGQTLASGALDAWAVDAARREQEPPRPDRLLARGFGAGSAAMIVSGLVGAYLGSVELRLIWLAGAAGFLATAALAGLTMHERWSSPAARSRAEPAVRGQLVRGLGIVRRTPVLLAIAGLTAASGFAQMPVLHYWPVKLDAVAAGPRWVLGWAWVLFAGLNLAGSQLVPRLVATWGRGEVAAGAELLRALGVGVAARAAGFRGTVAGVGGQAVGMGCMIPLVSAWVNAHVEERERATVLSVNAAAFTLGGAGGLVALGLVARAAGIGAAWGVSALVFGACAAGFAAVARTQRPGKAGGKVRGSSEVSTQSVPSAQ
jgi:MFS family permease